MTDYLSELEGYPDLEGSIIRTTKIHKVLKQMIKLEHIPLEEEFKFKDRSTKLLAKWTDTLSKDGPSDEKAEDKPETKAAERADAVAEPKVEEPIPATNGDAQATKELVQEAKSGEAAAPVEELADKLESKIDAIVGGGEEGETQTAAEASIRETEKIAHEGPTDEPGMQTASAVEATV